MNCFAAVLAALVLATIVAVHGVRAAADILGPARVIDGDTIVVADVRTTLISHGNFLEGPDR